MPHNNYRQLVWQVDSESSLVAQKLGFKKLTHNCFKFFEIRI